MYKVVESESHLLNDRSNRISNLPLIIILKALNYRILIVNLKTNLMHYKKKKKKKMQSPDFELSITIQLYMYWY